MRRRFLNKSKSIYLSNWVIRQLCRCVSSQDRGVSWLVVRYNTRSVIDIIIFTDSYNIVWISFFCKSKIERECQSYLVRVYQQFNIQIIWVLEHTNIPGKCTAYELTIKGIKKLENIFSWLLANFYFKKKVIKTTNSKSSDRNTCQWRAWSKKMDLRWSK